MELDAAHAISALSKLLIDAGADINQPDAKGRVPPGSVHKKRLGLYPHRPGPKAPLPGGPAAANDGVRARRPTKRNKAFGKTGRRGRRPLRHSIGKRCVGVGLLDDPPRACTDSHVIRRGGRLCPPADSVPHSRQGTRALPYKNGCRAGPMCPAALPHPLSKPCHCEGAPRPWQSASPLPKIFSKYFRFPS